MVHQRLDVLRGQHPDPPFICEPLQRLICESGVVSKLILHAIYCNTLNVGRFDAVLHDPHVAHSRTLVAHTPSLVAHILTVVAYSRNLVAHSRNRVDHSRTRVAHT